MELAAAAATGPAEMATPPQSTAAGLLEGAGDLFQLAGEPCQQEHFLVCDIGDQAEAGDRGGLPDEAERAALLEMSHDLNLGLGGASGELGETPSVLVEADVVHVFNEANEGAQHQQQQQQQQQQQPQQGERLEHSYASPLENVVRQERSNSCSGADSVSVARSLAAQAAGIPTPTGPMLAGSVDAINVTASVSQHDLIVGCGDEPTSLNFVESLLVEQSGGVAIDNEQPLVAEGSLHGDCSFTLPRAITDISTIGPSQSSTSLSSSPPQQAASGFEKQQLHSSKVHGQPNNEPQTASRNQNSSSSSSSSRFFSSKLNTGSLWSLLSVGSSNSMSAINEIAGPEVDDSTRDSLDAGEQPSLNQEATRGLHQKTPSGGAQQIRDFTTRSASNFFNQFKPKVVVDHHHQSSSANGRSQDSTPSAGPAGTTKAKEMGNQDSSRARSSRYRFNIKYVGSAMLHKNFTLPMLEWITKDIRRQTTRHGLNQRQFTIPVRDIIFEIHAKQLMAISCKDGHCIFVHPMHCVSKYAQLQHDSSSFAYIIRDSKDSPNFCHVFQTKSPNRVHEIFVAIREVTTRNQFASLPANSSLSSMNKHYQAANQQQAAELASLRLQKSASSDGHWRGSAAFAELNNSTLSMMDSPIPSSAKSPPAVTPLTSAQTDNPLLARYNNSPQQMQQQRNVVHHHHHQQASSQLAETISQQFENSYQFEVMFVKRVKLQCRRVPASFVDDALETLKTFEVPKSTQIKHGVVTKRIISASVDERQEYDESCQSPTPGASKSSLESALDNNKRLGSEIMPSLTTTSNSDSDRRGSSVSLRGQDRLSPSKSRQEANRESKSCQQSPAKQSPSANNPAAADQKEESTATASSNSASSSSSIRDDLLTTTDAEIRSKIIGIRQTEKVNPPSYTNDFSPYNTITSSDLNERIAAIPVVSGSSVSLDHETRQKLARQVRETIMATAANIKKDVYASGDNLNAIGSSSRVLDSLSCTQQVAPEAPQDTFNLIELDPISAEPAADLALDHSETTAPARQEEASQSISAAAQRRASAGPAFASTSGGGLQNQQAAANNFDLFRRASARQVVKNRTMLLLIGKDELCAISIDKHQMLFSKSFNSIVHCLSGTKNRDHFGLICRDSVKIQPQAEAYAGFVFKCQSEKVVREIMGALKQVIYSSQHNYHGLNSPYNPLNSLSSVQAQFNVSSKQQLQSTSKTFASDQRQRLTSSSMDSSSSSFQSSAQQQSSTSGSTRGLVGSSISSSPQAQTGVSLAAKRGFANPLEMNGSTPLAQSNDLASANVALHAVSQAASAMPTPPPPPPPPTAPPALGNVFTMPAPKNPIKSMFCDDCPLYWFHRLCCDIESLPAEASKAIILRRIDSSLSEQEQDEVFTKFSEHKIESIEEHNEIFMSVLRHLSEKKQFKHSQLAAHQNALAKNSLLVKKQSFDLLNKLQPSSGGNAAQQAKQQQQQQQQASNANTNAAVVASQNRGHQRSGSSGGSLAFIMGQPNGGQVNQSSLVDASSLAIDNLKRAKNSISVSIENLLKRRSSLRDEQNEADSAADASVLLLQTDATGHLPLRTGSFKSASREARQMTHQAQADETTANEPLLPGKDQAINNLRRSQSTSDYSQTSMQGNLARLPAATWRDSLSKTLNAEELTNPLVGFFRRRGSLANSETTTGAQDSGSVDHHGGAKTNSQRASTESLSICAAANGEGHSPSMSRPHPPSASRSGQSSPTNTSRMLSGSFWKKSIFDMVQKTSHAGQTANGHTYEEQPKEGMEQQRPAVKRSRAELRLLWRKAIREQITLLKMDKQNQELLKKTSAKCEQVSKGSTTNSTTAPEVSTMPTNQSATSTNNNNNNSKDEPPSNAQFIHSTIEGIKLNYAPVRWPPESQQQWDRILKQDPTKKVQFSEVARLVRFGVPMKRRGEIWMFLMNQYQLRYGTSFQPVGSDFKGDANQTYRGLLSQLSTQQHEIFVDIGRTFPSHPYYSQYLSIGQLSLFNLLKAYSLLDRQVGYCQGLSFVAGILLLHVDSEDEAFELMRHLMFNFGLRKQYLPSMDALHLQLYQMTRLLRDHEFAIFDHFDKHDISPSLYAAPWFLTLFASQFPLGFVTRLLDLIYLIGIEAIFRVSLTLLAFHRASIIKCSSLEFTMDFMRDGLSKIDDKNLVKIFTDALALDLRNKLIEYEIEYSFYCAEDKARAQSGTHHHYQHHHHHHRAGLSSRQSENSSSSTVNQDVKRDQDFELDLTPVANDSAVADATATVIIQHLLANNHLKSLRSNYSY